jgi:hypothetical protein
MGGDGRAAMWADIFLESGGREDPDIGILKPKPSIDIAGDLILLDL